MPVPNFPTRAELTSLISTNLAGSPTTINAAAHRDVENAIVNAIYGGQIGDIKEIACDSNYISTNFNVTGKGVQGGERYGWAICNGQNGTVDKRGRVAVGYDPNDPTYNVLYKDFPNTGNTGGEKTHTLLVTEMPPHSHFSYGYSLNRVGGSIPWYNWGSPGGPAATNVPDSLLTGGAGSTSTGNTTNGSTVPHNNMQPYVVTVFIQRIPTV